MFSNFSLYSTGHNSSPILTKLGMMTGYGSGMTPIVGISSLVIMTVSASFYHKKCFQTFRSTGHNSSPILAKLGKMTGYGSGMMPNVGSLK